jgi:hypothetical protein
MRIFNVYVVFVLSGFNCVGYFDTVSELVRYASKIIADTPNQSVEPYRPQFKKFHQAIPSLTETSIFSKLGFNKNRVLEEFKRYLSIVTYNRELEGYYGDFVKKVYIEDETKWFIWSSLHGAFHSLVRGLNELKKNKFIDDDLKLLQANTYLVFGGNLINYGAYQIETLLVILKLAEKNPKQVIILKGAFEQDGVWQKTNFIDELRTRFAVKNKEIPLEKEISKFFNTCALAVYLISTEDDVVRISFYHDHPLLKENIWGNFFNKKSTEAFKIKYITFAPNSRQLKARIESHAVQEVPHEIPGIAYGKDGDVHVWTLFSAPINMFRAYFNFYEDSVIQLTTGRYFSSWLLTFFNQDAHNLTGFVRSREFEIATGKEIFTANPVKRIEDLSKKIELAEIEQKQLRNACVHKQSAGVEQAVEDGKLKKE